MSTDDTVAALRALAERTTGQEVLSQVLMAYWRLLREAVYPHCFAQDAWMHPQGAVDVHDCIVSMSEAAAAGHVMEVHRLARAIHQRFQIESKRYPQHAGRWHPSLI